MAMFRNGIVLTQYKEPALSKAIVRFVAPQTDSMRMIGIASGDPSQMSVDDIIEIAKAAQIVDERDGKPLGKKLMRVRGRAMAVMADAVDDEPYVSSKLSPLLKNRDEVLGGIQLCTKVAGTGNAFVIVYKNIFDGKTKIPRSIGGIPVVWLGGGYPAPAQETNLKVGKGRKLIVGTGALIHLYRAVWLARRQSTVFITVAGNCVANPMNLEVSLGMTVAQVLERCGLSNEPTHVVCGGPMTGIAILDRENTSITHTTRAILAFRENKRAALASCIGCGRCEQVCPMGLNPMYIHRFVETSYYANLRTFDADLCIECGTCSYICPSKLPVAVSAQKAKEYARTHFMRGRGEDDQDD